MRFGQSGDTKSKEAGETEKESDGDIPEQKKVGRFHARHVSCLELRGSSINDVCTEEMGGLP